MKGIVIGACFRTRALATRINGKQAPASRFDRLNADDEIHFQLVEQAQVRTIGSQGVLNDDELALRVSTGDIAQQSLGDHALANIFVLSVFSCDRPGLPATRFP